MITVTNKTDWLREQAEHYPDETAYINTSQNISYLQFFLECKSLSEYFLNRGIKKQDHVGILSEHRYEFFLAVNALWFLGAVPVPLNIRNTPDELQYQINQADIKFLLFDKVFDKLTLVINNTYKILFPDYKEIGSLISTNNYRGINESKFNIDSNALILFTSGSSGKPKAVLHTFNSLFESVLATDSFSELAPSDIWLASLPFYHIGGFMILVRSLLTGSKVTLPDSLKYEDIKTSIELFNPSHISLVPIILNRLIAGNIPPNKNLKIVYLGGGPSESILCIEAVNKGWNIVKVFGSTETCSMITALHPNELNNKIESAGRPIGSNQIKIVDESGKRLEVKQIGEIAVFSSALFKEYYKEPDLTNYKLIEGWYYTGDFGWIDEEGYLYSESRREDLIVTGGENVSSAEIEVAIKSNPSIEDVYVFGIEDKQWGQTVAAVVKTQLNCSISKVELKNYLKEIIAGYKIPKEFYFLDIIPKNEMGKVIRSDVMKFIKVS